MIQVLPYIRWSALAVFIGMCIAKYGFGYTQLASYTLIPAVIWVAAGLAMRSGAKSAEMSSDASPARLAIAEQMIAHYNAQDADAYAALMTDDACEAGYRGAVVREGKEGTRAGLQAMFAEFPENRAEILKGYELGEYVALHERVLRSATAEPFEVMSIYSFEGDKVSRVEFVR